MTFNPDLARERMDFLRCRIWDAKNWDEAKRAYCEFDWWWRELRGFPND